MWELFSGSILVVIIVLAFVMIFVARKRLATLKYDYLDNYMGYGIGIGMAIGVSIGLALGNMAFGPSIGVAIGVALGKALQDKYGKKIKMTTELRARNMRLVTLGAITLVLGIIVLALFLYMI